MIEKTLTIGDREVKFKSSASIPRIYRARFGRDIFRDLHELQRSVDSGNSEASDIPIENLEIFENVAYIMARHADPENTPENIDEWLDQFEMFSIYEILPEILDLWGSNMQTSVDSKKKTAPAPAN